MAYRFDRREFLYQSVLGCAAVTLGGACCSEGWMNQSAVAPPAALPVGDASLLVQLTGPGVPGDLAGSLRKLLEPLGGMGAFVKPGRAVLLKPNLGFPTPPEWRANTATPLIAAVARLVLEQGAGKVIVADFPVHDSERTVELMGLREAVRGLGVQVIAVTDENDFVEVKIPRGRSLTRTDVLKEALEAEVHIALPLAKSHGGAGFTGTLKGMMGLIATRKTLHWRHDLHQSIADLNTVIRPNLIILDGLEVMVTEGPRGPGRLVKTDSLIAGIDPVAVDAAGVRLAPLFGKQIQPHQIKHIAIAASMGLGQIELPAPRNVRIQMA